MLRAHFYANWILCLAIYLLPSLVEAQSEITRDTFQLSPIIKRWKNFEIGRVAKSPIQKVYLQRKTKQTDITRNLFLQLSVATELPFRHLRETKLVLQVEHNSGKRTYSNPLLVKSKDGLVHYVTFRMPVADYVQIMDGKLLLNSTTILENGHFTTSQKDVTSQRDQIEYGIWLPSGTRPRKGYRMHAMTDQWEWVSNEFKVKRRIPAIFWVPPLMPVAGFFIFVFSIVLYGYDM